VVPVASPCLPLLNPCTCAFAETCLPFLNHCAYVSSLPPPEIKQEAPCKLKTLEAKRPVVACHSLAVPSPCCALPGGCLCSCRVAPHVLQKLSRQCKT
jgi:hypothetical protein